MFSSQTTSDYERLQVTMGGYDSDCNFIKNETPAQMLFCEYCETFKNNYFEEHLPTAASEKRRRPNVSGVDQENTHSRL